MEASSVEAHAEGALSHDVEKLAGQIPFASLLSALILDPKKPTRASGNLTEVEARSLQDGQEL